MERSQELLKERKGAMMFDQTSWGAMTGAMALQSCAPTEWQEKWMRAAMPGMGMASTSTTGAKPAAQDPAQR
jgi:hypothetical protein